MYLGYIRYVWVILLGIISEIIEYSIEIVVYMVLYSCHSNSQISPKFLGQHHIKALCVIECSIDVAVKWVKLLILWIYQWWLVYIYRLLVVCFMELA